MLQCLDRRQKTEDRLQRVVITLGLTNKPGALVVSAF